MEALLVARQVETVDFSQAALPHFVPGAQAHHHKVDPKARFNLGDLFSYALARETQFPLFFQGTDYSKTSIENAMTLLGCRMSEKGVLELFR